MSVEMGKIVALHRPIWACNSLVIFWGVHNHLTMYLISVWWGLFDKFQKSRNVLLPFCKVGELTRDRLNNKHWPSIAWCCARPHRNTTLTCYTQFESSRSCVLVIKGVFLVPTWCNSCFWLFSSIAHRTQQSNRPGSWLKSKELKLCLCAKYGGAF